MITTITMIPLRLLGLALLLGFCTTACSADVLDDLARDFWDWRAREMPVRGT